MLDEAQAVASRTSPVPLVRKLSDVARLRKLSEPYGLCASRVSPVPLVRKLSGLRCPFGLS